MVMQNQRDQRDLETWRMEMTSRVEGPSLWGWRDLRSEAARRWARSWAPYGKQTSLAAMPLSCLSSSASWASTTCLAEPAVTSPASCPLQPGFLLHPCRPTSLSFTPFPPGSCQHQPLPPACLSFFSGLHGPGALIFSGETRNGFPRFLCWLPLFLLTPSLTLLSPWGFHCVQDLRDFIGWMFQPLQWAPDLQSPKFVLLNICWSSQT